MNADLSYGVKKFIEAVENNIEAERVSAEQAKRYWEAYYAYLYECAPKINRFLKESGSDLIYNPGWEGFYDFVKRNFELASLEQDEIYDFLRTLPRFKYNKETKPAKIDTYKIFLEESVPYDLTREDFPSEECYREYKYHVYAATHD